MSNLNFSHLLEINKKYSFINNIKYLVIFGECNICINNLKNFFYEIHSIDIVNKNYDNCKKKFLPYSKINIYKYSENILSSIISKINSGTVYFININYIELEENKNYIDLILNNLNIIIENDYNNSIIIINNFNNKILTSPCLNNIKEYFFLSNEVFNNDDNKFLVIILKNRNCDSEENNSEENNSEENNSEENNSEENNSEENNSEENNSEEYNSEENNSEDLIFYKNGYKYKNIFNDCLIEQNRKQLEQILRIKDKLNLNIIDNRNLIYK